jgi:hypothetical protein
MQPHFPPTMGYANDFSNSLPMRGDWNPSPSSQRRYCPRSSETVVRIPMSAGLATWWWDHQEVSREEMVETVVDMLWTGAEQILRPGRSP